MGLADALRSCCDTAFYWQGWLASAGREPFNGTLAVQSPGLPHVDFEGLIGQEMTVKVLEAMEDKDRLILSNKKTAFDTNKKLSYTVRLAPPLCSAYGRETNRKGVPLGDGSVLVVTCGNGFWWTCMELPCMRLGPEACSSTVLVMARAGRRMTG